MTRSNHKQDDWNMIAQMKVQKSVKAKISHKAKYMVDLSCITKVPT